MEPGQQEPEKNKNDPWKFFSTVLLELRRKTEDLGLNWKKAQFFDRHLPLFLLNISKRTYHLYFFVWSRVFVVNLVSG